MDEVNQKPSTSRTLQFFEEIEEEDAMEDILHLLKQEKADRLEERLAALERREQRLAPLERRVGSLEQTMRQALQVMKRVLEERQGGVAERVEASIARHRLDEMEDRLSTLEVLLHGAPPSTDAQTEAVTEALTEAALEGRVEEVKSLLSRGASVDAENFGRSALYFASAAGNPEVVTVLLRSGADANFMDFDGESPLHAAATSGNAECLHILLAAGALVDTKDNRGRTALHMAAVQGHVDSTRALLAAGAATDAVDNIDRKPEDVAANEAVRALIRNAGDENASDEAQQET